jgi:hypothetical protein
MLGSHFYHQRIRKAVAVFGSLFNNINVIRKNSTGEVISQVKVPLSYAPKRDFLTRMDNMLNGETNERQIALKLPRMSFEIVAMNYDPTRQLPKMNNCVKAPTTYTGSATQLYTPVPYNINFQLSIYGKSQDDVLQIIEQIIPYFTPQYTVTVNPFTEYDVKEDTPITMTGITFSDDYEGAIENRRSIIYTLDFEMKISLYKGAGASGNVITSADVLVKDLEGNDLFTTSVVGNVITGTSGTLLNEDGGTITSPFKVVNVQDVITSFTIGTAPANGTAIATLTKASLSTSGANLGVGTWTYTPDPDYSGADSFVIKVNMADGNHILQSITVNTVNAVDDAINSISSIDTGVVAYVDIDVGANDTFESTSIVYTIPAGGDPDNGTVAIQDAANGIIRYTPTLGFTGVDIFTYRVTPSTGQAETATVTVTVT